MSTQWKHGRRSVAAFLLTLAVSCRDATPAEPVLTHVRAITARSLQLENEITIVDTANQVSYTLNVAERRILSSNNEEMVLDEELTAVAAALFHGVLETDKTAADLLSASGANDCELPPRDGGDCQAAAARLDPTIEDRRRVRGSEELRVRVRFGLPSTATTLSDTRARSAFARVDGTLLQAGSGVRLSLADRCSDIARAVVPQTFELKRQRTAFWSEVLPFAAIEVANGIRRFVVPGWAAGAKLLEIAAEHATARVALTVMGAMWNGWRCHDRPVRVGPIILEPVGRIVTTNGIGKPLKCREQAVQISFKEGEWYDVVLIICEYDQT